jgi:hypothetical protein
MNKLLVALIAGGFAAVAAAQTPAPAAAPATPAAPATKKEMNAEKAKAVGAVTEKESDTSGTRAMAAEQKANTAASKKIAKPTAAQKQADSKAATTAGGMSSTGGPETAAQAKKNTAASKEVAKEKVNLGTPAAEKEMAKKATP